MKFQGGKTVKNKGKLTRAEKIVLKLSEEYSLPIDPDLAYKYSRLSTVGDKAGISSTTVIGAMKKIKERQGQKHA